MTDPEMLSWLRAAITERLGLARKANTGDRWEADKHYDALWSVDLQPSAGTVSDGEDWQSAQVTGIADAASYEAPRWLLAFTWHARHIAANDPQDTIARCEAELAILDACEEATEAGRIPEGATWSDDAAGAVLAERVISLVAAGYRHHPGWKAEWAT